MSNVVLCSTNIADDSDDDHNDAIISGASPINFDPIQDILRRRYNPKPISAAHNYRSDVDSSESEDDQRQAPLYQHNKHLRGQPRSMNDISSLLRMLLIGHNQRVDAGVAVGRPQMTINHNRRPVAGYSDSVDTGVAVGRPQMTINHNRRPVAGYSDSTDDEGLTRNCGKIKHFSHPHNLNKYNIRRHSEINCKVCGLELFGSAYGCHSCQFYMHASCFDLPQKIQHDSHTAHPLKLRYPSFYKHCGKTCDACCENIRQSFLYCCDQCDFDLHVSCATLYSIARTADKSNDTLRLYYTFPFGDSNNNIIARCSVCNKRVSKEGWLYYNKDTGHIAHIKCAKDAKVGPSWIKEKLNMLKIK